jgi:hypothetical protein
MVGVGAGAWVYSQPVPRDEESFCPILPDGSGKAVSETAHHILVIDKTDKWTPPQEARLRNIVLGMRDHLGVNERLTIFVFSDTVKQGFSYVFSHCNPGRGSDTNMWTSNPRRWEQQFNAKFGQPLDEIMADLIRATEGPRSPILEVMIDLTNREELIRRDIPRRIVLVSDMLQNSDAYTFFAPRAPRLAPAPQRSAPPPGIGGPFVPLNLTPPAPRETPARPIAAAPKQKAVEARKLTPKEVTDIVEKRGGLAQLRKFNLEVYQIRGVYPEDKLSAARAFWDLVATQYGATINWKVL